MVSTAVRLPRRRLAAPAAATVAAATAVALTLGACTGASPPVAPGRLASSAAAGQTGSDDSRRDDALRGLLRERAAAVLAHDRKRFAATLDDPGSAFGRRQLEAFAALDRLPLKVFTYGGAEPAPELSAQRLGVLGAAAWVARVPGSYSLRGYDAGQRTYESYFTVVHRDGVWRIADDRDGGTQQQMWDLPGLRVVADGHVLVAGNAPQSSLRSYLRLGQQAVKDVAAVWKATWPRRLVVVAARTPAQARDQLAVEQADLGQVAAVTDGPQSPETGLSLADRIVLNPGAFARLRPTGQQVVLSHEATHVAVRASAGGQVPTWLSEGFADYVGYRPVGLPRRAVAAELLKQVRAGKVPTTLPGDSAFDPARSTIAPSYNGAWLAMCLIADRWGQGRLASFYRAAAGPNSGGQLSAARVAARTDRAFSQVLGTSTRAFTARWRSYLVSLAR